MKFLEKATADHAAFLPPPALLLGKLQDPVPQLTPELATFPALLKTAAKENQNEKFIVHTKIMKLKPFFTGNMVIPKSFLIQYL